MLPLPTLYPLFVKFTSALSVQKRRFDFETSHLSGIVCGKSSPVAVDFPTSNVEASTHPNLHPGGKDISLQGDRRI
jgi:hypothetical protein